MITLFSLVLLLAGCGDDKDAPTDADGDGFLSDQDCDDQDAAVHPAADEACNGADDDCDGEIDEHAEDQLDWYLDADGDDYGEPSYGVRSCEQPEGYAASAWDCDDADDAVFPGASEVCDGKDDDCDGLVDDADPSLETGTATTWHRDADGDGYGDVDDAGALACADPSTAYAAYVAEATDCDDAEPAVNPAAEELCGNGRDDDCDGEPGACAPEEESALAEADATIFGGEAERLVPRAVSPAGDADGDGQQDLWIRSYDGASRGSARRFDGPLLGGLSLSAAAATLVGEGRIAFGDALLGDRDLDGDGWPDLAASDPYDDVGGASAGAVGLYGGPLTGELSAEIADAWLTGEAAAATAGRALGALDDQDGDGLAELLVGSPGSAEGGLSAAGAILLVAGGAEGAVSLAEAAARLAGEEAGQYAGEVFTAADLDGDGLEDLLVGTPGLGAGRLYAWSGPLSGSASLADAPLRLLGETEGDLLGAAVAAGDWNDDGYPDAAVGAPGAAVDGAAEAGRIWLFAGGASLPGALSDAIATLDGGAAGDSAGYSLAGIGDLTGDGEEDLLVGAPGADSGAGAALLLKGELEGAIALAEADWIIHGTSGSASGYPVIGGVDLTGDGEPDLGVGAPYDARAGADAGAFAIFSYVGW